jgi:alkaline phosphatase
MTYVDGFVLVVPKKKLGAYKRMAEKARKLWRKHGALDYKECVGDDLSPDVGGVPIVKFPKMAKARTGEIVVFSFIVYRSRAHRDKVNAKVMKDPSMKDPEFKEPMPFDMKRVAYGGFKVIVG